MRKIFYILSISIFLNVAYSECQGDVNDDYNIDVLDVISIINHILGNEEFSEDLILIADMNDDGNIDILDIISVVNIVLYENNPCIPDASEICDNEYDIISGDFIACDSDCFEYGNECYLTSDIDVLIDLKEEYEQALAQGISVYY